MKKLYFLLLIGVTTLSTNAQNLVTNPSFNDGLNGWLAGPISSYTLPTVVSTDGSDGANSAQYVASATTGFYQEIPVTAGHRLKISFYYKATGDDTDARIWSAYKNDANEVIYPTDDAKSDPLRTYDGYLPTSANWNKYDVEEVTVPAGATKLSLAFRAYNRGTASFDQISVEDLDALSTPNFNAIEGLKMYPNPLSGNILNFSTTNNATLNVQIFNILGKEVLNTKIKNTINVADLSAGVYIVQITENGKTATRKLVVR